MHACTHAHTQEDGAGGEGRRQSEWEVGRKRKEIDSVREERRRESARARYQDIAGGEFHAAYH